MINNIKFVITRFVFSSSKCTKICFHLRRLGSQAPSTQNPGYASAPWCRPTSCASSTWVVSTFNLINMTIRLAQLQTWDSYKNFHCWKHRGPQKRVTFIFVMLADVDKFQYWYSFSVDPTLHQWRSQHKARMHGNILYNAISMQLYRLWDVCK